MIVTGVASVDLFAAERLLEFYRKLKERNTAFYLAGHASSVNEQLIAYGAEALIHEGVVKQRLTQALRAGGLTPPYPLDDAERVQEVGAKPEAFAWAYGKYSRPRLEQLARQLAQRLLRGENLDTEQWSQAAREYWNQEDEEGFLDQMEMSLAAAFIERQGDQELFQTLAWKLLDRRVHLEWDLLRTEHPQAAQAFLRQRLRRKEDFRSRHLSAWERMETLRLRYMEDLREREPEVAGDVEAFAEQVKRGVLTETAAQWSSQNDDL